MVSLDTQAEPRIAEQMFGKYELLERIGSGGMAEVYKAASISVGGFRKLVALKRILQRLSGDAEFVSLFISEAKLAVTLTHSNIVQVFDFGLVDLSYYLTMELVDGRDLTQVLVKQTRRRLPLPIEVACYVFSEALLGLEHAHSRVGPDGGSLNIVHRDVSPHNLLVSYDGEVRLTDFGIAKARTRVALHRSGLVLGKFAYMSPEQARGLELDARSDVYSAGVSLYETLTCRRLFYSDDPAETLARVKDPRVWVPSSYNSEIPSGLDEIVMTALAPEPERRFQSAREFSNALRSYLHRLRPEFDDSHLARFMKGLFQDEVGPERFPMAADSAPPKPPRNSLAAADRPFDDIELRALGDKLTTEPNLWTLVRLGDRLLALGQRDGTARVLRIAAVKFAQNGLLIQAIACYVRLRDLVGWSDGLADEISRVPSLPGLANARLRRDLPELGRDSLGLLLRGVFEAAEPPGIAGVLGSSSPLISTLGRNELTKLVFLLRLRPVAPGAVIMREGQPGSSVYSIARGRVVIYCESARHEKVYLSSLSDGDCVGEFSFFTGAPRAATVEAIDDVMLFEIARQDFDHIVLDFPNLTHALLEFYKARVVGTLLAKSEVFGVLEPRVRASLAARLTLEAYDKGDVIIREGDDSDGFYLIKSGDVEVFRSNEVFLSKLRPGDFFGEIAAIQGTRRTASVRALGPCEMLRLSGRDLHELASQHPAMMEILENCIASRTAEALRAMTAGGQLV